MSCAWCEDYADGFEPEPCPLHGSADCRDECDCTEDCE